MRLKDILLRDKPVTINHEKLGILQWSKTNNEWSGCYNSLKFTIHHEKNHIQPSAEIVAYICSMLMNIEFLKATLQEEKGKWKKQYKSDKEQMKELSDLQFEKLDFYRYKDKVNKIFATLSPEIIRSWRIEYKEMECIGLGFDS